MCRILDNSPRKTLLGERDLQKMFEICKIEERVKTQAKELFGETCNMDLVCRDVQ